MRRLKLHNLTSYTTECYIASSSEPFVDANRAAACVSALFAVFAVFAAVFNAAFGADGAEPYQSSYASSSSTSRGIGISQYQAMDRASAYQNEMSRPHGNTTNAAPAVREAFVPRERYSSKTAARTSLGLPASPDDYADAPSYAQFPVGSDAYLDAATYDVYAKRAMREGAAPNADPTAEIGAPKASRQSKGIFGYAVETNAKEGDTFYERWVEPDVPREGWTSQLLPQGVAYPSYLASRKDARLESIINHTEGYGTLWDITLGGKTAIWRLGTTDTVQPEGWELELEGAALLRLDWERHRNLAATDYHAGVPIVYSTKRWQFKTGYYHVSSHLGDNYLMDKFRPRVHYSRDAIMFGLAVKPIDDVRIYTELDYAFHCGQTTEPVELQLGLEYSPQYDPNMSNWVARPFFASHVHLFQERDFGGYWCTQTGIQWRSQTNDLMRLGFEYFQGGDDEYQFHHHFQRKYGLGFWYDF